MAKKSKAAPKKKTAEIEEIETNVEDFDGEEASEEKPSKKAKKSSGSDGGSVYKVIEVIGASNMSWEHAAQIAVKRASQTLEDLRIAEVVDQDLKIENGNITAYRTKLRLSFKFKG